MMDKKTFSENRILSDIEVLRDPFAVLSDDGTYYLYGTGWVFYKNTSGSLDGHWEGPFNCVDLPYDAEKDHWAPEVHRYNGAYYMFTTYKSKSLNHRGCAIFRSESPEGPFKLWSDGIITPSDWDSIDGTFYLDKDSQPWMIFVHEWTSTDDGCGRMAVAKLSKDLKRFETEPIELFRADSAKWAKSYVTDGCFIYSMQDGSLIMLWSNWDSLGYSVGIAHSQSGLVTGPWIQEEDTLYSKKDFNDYDGGHGMIFNDKTGIKYLVIHSPNSKSDGRREKPIFIKVEEKDRTLKLL